MTHTWYHIENEDEIASPALLLYRGRIEHNLRVMVDMAGDVARLRPHVKTHKLGQIIQWQVRLGITRFKCSTIAEVEMTAEGGGTDILLALPCVGPNAHRLAELALKFPNVKFSAIADDEATIRSLASAAQQAGVVLGIYLDVDCGMHRTGIEPGEHALSLCHSMKDAAKLQFQGLHAYDGHIHDADAEVRRRRCDEAFAPVVKFRNELQSQGLIVKEIVAGGSPTFPFHAEHVDRTCSPGTTVLWDFGYGERMPEMMFQPAAVLLARVISKPASNRITLDLGHKAVAAENPHPRVKFLEVPDAKAVMHSEEHLVLETEQASEFKIGQALHGIPLHVCPTVALHDEAVLISEGKAVERWPILARRRKITI